MKQAIMYGAGNIGRGFIGQLFHMSGYETSFIDVNMAVIDQLNTDRQYPVYITDGDCYKEYLDYYNYAIGKTPKLINL